jgi:hypothetical protein
MNGDDYDASDTQGTNASTDSSSRNDSGRQHSTDSSPVAEQGVSAQFDPASSVERPSLNMTPVADQTLSGVDNQSSPQWQSSGDSLSRPETDQSLTLTGVVDVASRLERPSLTEGSQQSNDIKRAEHRINSLEQSVPQQWESIREVGEKLYDVDRTVSGETKVIDLQTEVIDVKLDYPDEIITIENPKSLENQTVAPSRNTTDVVSSGAGQDIHDTTGGETAKKTDSARSDSQMDTHKREKPANTETLEIEKGIPDFVQKLKVEFANKAGDLRIKNNGTISDVHLTNPEPTISNPKNNAYEIWTTVKWTEKRQLGGGDKWDWPMEQDVRIGKLYPDGSIITTAEVDRENLITSEGLGPVDYALDIVAAGGILKLVGESAFSMVGRWAERRAISKGAESFIEREASGIGEGSLGKGIESATTSNPFHKGKPVSTMVNEEAGSKISPELDHGPPTGPLAGATEEELELAIEEATSPRARGRNRPMLEDRPIPTRRVPRLDIDDIWRFPGESQRQAVERVQHIIGQRIDQTPLLDAWDAARARVLGNRSLDSITRDEMLRDGGFYDRVRNAFWDEVRTRSDALRFIEDVGLELRQQRAPLLRVTSSIVPDEEIRVSLDHIAEKAIGDNWRRAIDPDNLSFEFQSPNSFREIIQRRHKLRGP